MAELPTLREGAPPNHGNTGPDISRADFTWCMTAFDLEDWTVEEVAERIMTLSSKARENGTPAVGRHQLSLQIMDNASRELSGSGAGTLLALAGAWRTLTTCKF